MKLWMILTPMISKRLMAASNPLLEVTDIRKVGEAAKKRGISFFTFNANANAQQS